MTSHSLQRPQTRMESMTSKRCLNPMNAARPADGLLSAAQTIALLEAIGQRGVSVTEDQAARDMSARRSASFVRTFNSIAMLEAIGIVGRCEDRVFLNISSKARWRTLITDWVAHTISVRIGQGGAHALQFHGDVIVLDPMRLPGPVDGLPLWLIEFGVALKSGSTSRHWIISKNFERYFLEAARIWNHGTRRSMSQATLEKRLANQAVNGEEAEEWLLSRERLRLESHPLIDQVVRLSIEDVGAGFDIISFSTPTAVVHDHFLEVKSFAGRRRFFWSRNEIEAARRLGEAYQLCLIDRECMWDESYIPEMISGPYAALIETAGNGWSISPTTFECVALDF
ncbi:MAG: hypothetical protein DI498_14160 [Paracoccus denitrificans]|nr:MAG: hypothetical protein DI498_14160 [Paracoccus denitrificans]PZO82808.1 MAG: hypothetical protein DI633_14160 [Paracoccus denitrificans]